MQCPICDTSIDEIEVDVCPACGEPLGEAVFPEEISPLVDDHRGGLRAVADMETGGSEPDEHRVVRASDQEEVLVALAGEEGWVVPPHHPSGGRKFKLVKFFLFRVNLGGRIHFIWVRSTAKTPAVEQLLKWIRNEMGWRPCDRVGQEFPWGLSGRDLAIKYKAEMPLVSQSDTLPDDAAEYIDAYYVDKPAKVVLRG
jgi:hypothetical protein